MLWYERYRPTNLVDYVWTNPDTKVLLETWIDNPLKHPSLMLTGSTGTGKTTMAKIIRGNLSDQSDAKFIPASLRSGVDTIRDEIVGFCEAGGFNGLKLIILDEADRLSRDAQEMMRNVIDRYQDDVRFILTCNYPDKIIPALRGRLWTVNIDALDEEQFLDRLIYVLDQENIDYSSDRSMERLEEVVDANYPNLRHAISDLQRSALSGVLSDPQDDTISKDWEEKLLNLFDDFSVSQAREFVTSLRPDDCPHAYRVLYQNSSMFGEYEADSVIIIAEHLYRGSQAGFPEIYIVFVFNFLKLKMGKD